jgi:hypothetical protein
MKWSNWVIGILIMANIICVSIGWIKAKLIYQSIEHTSREYHRLDQDIDSATVLRYFENQFDPVKKYHATREMKNDLVNFRSINQLPNKFNDTTYVQRLFDLNPERALDYIMYNYAQLYFWRANDIGLYLPHFYPVKEKTGLPYLVYYYGPEMTRLSFDGEQYDISYHNIWHNIPLCIHKSKLKLLRNARYWILPNALSADYIEARIVWIEV